MPTQWIKDFSNLATSKEREAVLKVVEAGLEAINTEEILNKQFFIQDSVLHIDHHSYKLADFSRIYVFAFGKSSAKTAEVVEKILGDKITDGVVVSIRAAETKRIRPFVGTHPKPSMQNVTAAQEMQKIIAQITEKDLIINLITGGGSALLCWDEQECQQGKMLYENYLKAGDDIVGLNTVRKHISQVKGGGLAKMLYPAKVVSVIFSDVSGGRDDLVTSGPTYFDESENKDAQAIIEKYKLGEYKLSETPKDKKYFENVDNIVLVSNTKALEAMKQCAEGLGVKAEIMSNQIYSSVEETIANFKAAAKKGVMVLGGGEVKFEVLGKGKGGRSSFFMLNALKALEGGEVVVSVDSDGIDNSDAAGVIVDATTTERFKAANMNLDQALKDFSSYDFFAQLGRELIFTGPTQANVSDLIVWYKY